MPVVAPDPSAAGTPTSETVYVWECLGQPGDYAICSNPKYTDYQNPNWKFRGEFSSVAELDNLPRIIVKNRAINGWPFIVHVDRNGSYIF